jgi:outer membrane protein assembly factor BamD
VLIGSHSSDLGRSGLRRVTLAVAAVCLLTGCSWLGGRPTTLLPAGQLYARGEDLLARERYDQARDNFRMLVERQPESDLVPVATFLVGETYYRATEYEKAAPEFETFVTLYPGHAIADLGQYRLARSYFDQMPTLERDQAITARALAEFYKLIKLYPESRYAPDAIVKIEACRLRLAEKELWIAAYYVRRGNLQAALPRYDTVLKEYPRTQAAPEALYRKGDALLRLGRTEEAQNVFKQLDANFPQNEWSRRAKERLSARTGS